MYKLKKTVIASKRASMPDSPSRKLSYSPKDISELISSIDELHGKQISVAETKDGTAFAIGDTVYVLSSDN